MTYRIAVVILHRTCQHIGRERLLDACNSASCSQFPKKKVREERDAVVPKTRTVPRTQNFPYCMPVCYYGVLETSTE